tara:strand:+ start:7271 stop:8131 length:861 start_codon:yes stop_codon:yes gene_type:complete
MDMWFEKYRPQTIEEYVCDDRTKSIIKNTLRQQTHLLLHGLAGSGKTTLCKILINEIGNSGDIMTINASEENGVDVIRHKINSFISTMGWSRGVQTGKTKKIVFLDEFDYMTNESQSILRGMMEKHTERVMFIMTCNYIHKVIEPIQSRCFTRKMMTPNIYLVRERCQYILNEEGVSYSLNDLNLLINVCYPDFRKTINLLQNHSVDGEFEPIDTRDYESDRLTILNQFISLCQKIEYNSMYINTHLNHSEVKLFEKLVTQGFLIDKVGEDKITETHLASKEVTYG